MQAAIDGRSDEAISLLCAHIERTGAILLEDPALRAAQRDPG